MLSTVLLSFGVPLLLGGDEIGRTQQGNNNAYCQDNEITWFDWSAVDEDLLDDDFLVFFNAWWEPLDFVIPTTRDGQAWRAEIDSYDPAAAAAAGERHAGDRVTVGPRSVTVLRSPRPGR